jgi:hypothetical protein
MLDDEGMNYFFLYTLTGYGPGLERQVPPLREQVEEFLWLTGRIGLRRVVWRYDPVVLTEEMDLSYHYRNFRNIAGLLQGGTERVVVSFLKPYRKTRVRMKGTGYRLAEEHEQSLLLQGFESVADACGMRLQCCAVPGLQGSALGGKCIDDRLIREETGIELPSRKDPGQPPLCRCIRSIDIGSYNTCMHGCRYCYATGDRPRLPERAAGERPFPSALG